MEKIKNPSLNTRTFLLSYMAVIWRRVWITGLIYTEHNKLPLNKNILSLSIKYNIFAGTGIVSILKPYIIKSLEDGFMMPRFYEKNYYATRVVKLYKSSYEVAKADNAELEIKFIKDYVFKLYDEYNENKTKEMEIEKKDIVGNNKSNYINLICDCQLCNNINSWNIHSDLIYAENVFQNVMLKGLMATLENTIL